MNFETGFRIKINDFLKESLLQSSPQRVFISGRGLGEDSSLKPTISVRSPVLRALSGGALGKDSLF
jgi:hypothetical protein